MDQVNRVVDLTLPITSAVAMWPGQPGPQYDVKLQIDSHGVFLREIRLWEHTGTHLDAPAHFFHDAMTVDAVPVPQLVRPAVVFDIADRCQVSPDALLTVNDVLAHEEAHGQVQPGDAALVYTGWDRYADDAERYMGADEEGRLHFPGVSEAAARLLIEERGAVGIGIDTLSVDAGADDQYPVHRLVTLPNAAWNLEELVHLGELPPTGTQLVVGVLPFVGGSGAPARVLALLPSVRSGEAS